MGTHQVLRALHRLNDSIAKKALQRLHIRWWHASIEQLTNVLKAAGAPPRAVNMIPAVVGACQVCRTWKRPSNRSILTSSLSTQFNEDVQFDLFFYESLLEPDKGRRPVCHLIDTCLRWSSTMIARSKNEDDLTNAIGQCWANVFGPRQRLTLFEETGMRGRVAQDWAVQSLVTSAFKAPLQKAWPIDRHNELQRSALHRPEAQVTEK